MSPLEILGAVSTVFGLLYAVVRLALNGTKGTVKSIDQRLRVAEVKLDEIGEDVAYMRGKFSPHKEYRSDR